MIYTLTGTNFTYSLSAGLNMAEIIFEHLVNHPEF